MSFPTLSAEDTAMLEAACEGDQNTLATIEAFCSSKTDSELCEVVQDHLVHAKGTAVFAAGLARAISRLRSLGGRPDSHRRGRILRAVGLCVSKALQADLAELRILGLHRGLRQPALLLALTEVVPDNSLGSDAQRAAASALVAFCDMSPTLWKELAKLIRGDAKLLKGFLGQASNLASITDHRTQEIAFEAVYRMWKVWKKQPGGPPALPFATRNEIKEGLSGISTTDFESQVRSMLATINTGGDCDSDDGGCGGPPSSFPVEAVCQVTDWAGLGCEQRLGDVKWLDVGGDSISIQVYPKSSRGRDGDSSPGVFVSIPADVVAASSKIMVGTRSMQLDVPFLQCPALIRVAKKPPGSEPSSVSCTLIFRLQGGAKTFNLLRKTIAGLTSTVAKKREEYPSPRAAKTSVVISNDVSGHLGGKQQRLPDKQPKPVAPGGTNRGETKRVRRPEETPTKAADNQGRLGINGCRVSTNQHTPSAAGGNPRSATKRARQPKETPKKAGDNQPAHKKSRPAAAPTTSPFELTEENVRPTNTMAAPTPKKNPTPAQSTIPIRTIAEGNANAPPSVGSVEDSEDDKEDADKDSWMEPRHRLDLAPAGSRGKKAMSRVYKAKKQKDSSRAKRRGKGSGRGSTVPERKKEWEMSDDEEEVPALSQSTQQLSPAGKKLGKRAEKKSGAMPLESDDHRRDAETVKRGYSPGVDCRDDGVDDPATLSDANRKRPAPRSGGSATDGEQACRYRPQIDYAERDSEDPEEEAEEVTTTNDYPDEDGEENSAPWRARKAGFSNTRADHGEESESEDGMDGYCDAEEGVANDDSGEGGCVEEEEDSEMLAQLYKQLVMASQARDKRSKKRKTDARMEEAWEECGSYLERTSQAVVEHWRRQAGELLEEGREMEEAVGAAKEAIRAMNLQHEAQWNASKERLKKHASVLERLGCHLASGPGASSSSLERQREDETAALQLELQEHRVGAVSRFAKTLTNVEKKKPKTAFGGGRGSSLANTSAILSHLKMRTK